ncbi:hypothetical protein [Geodermatophilus sp. URMC 64]
MRRTLTLCRTGLAGVAAVVLLTACSGGDSDDSAASSSASETTTSSSATSSSATDPEAAAFCQQVTEVFGQLQSASSDPAQAGAVLQQVVDAVDQVDAPTAIEQDWAALGDALRQLQATAATLDLSTPEGQAQFEQAEQQITAQVSEAQSNVSSYVVSNCASLPTSAAPTS